MIDFWEVINRSENGELMEERAYDRLVGKVSKEVIKKYNIKYDPEEIVTSDDNLADRLFNAAVEFFVKVGVYNCDTGRVINFKEKELFEALEATPDQIVWGQGRDQRILHRRPLCRAGRHPESNTRIHAGGERIHRRHLIEPHHRPNFRTVSGDPTC